jgi:D-alanyl-lipoteichoic acid acyltransferase DltB (MBOAT superfamily)
MLPFDIDKLLNELLYQPEAPIIFSSALFLYLFVGFFAIYLLVFKKQKLRILYVTVFSVYFYYKSSGWYFLLLLFLTISDYNLARIMGNSERKSIRIFLLVSSLVLNLGVLAYFKYTNFIFAGFYELLNKPFDPFAIFLPVGISFFTFQSLSYTIDVYRRNIMPLKSISEFAFFTTFFPQMVAGPIVRAADFIPQIFKTPYLNKQDFGKAIFLISTGLFKKAVISDYISLNFVDRIFDAPALYTGFENLMGVYGYALQIYCDFSGYSDMAIGIALLLGYKLNINFDSPYQSSSITEFWRRWHISLSTWLRDYLYISLGGNRKGKIRTYINLLITMLLGGLWHGAALRFIIWGALHGVMLAIEKFMKSIITIPQNKITKIIGILLTFHFVCFTWIFFRADDMQTVGAVLTQIFTAFHPEIIRDYIVGYPLVSLLMLTGFVLHFTSHKTEQKVENLVIRSPFILKLLYLSLIIFIVIQIKSSEIQPFIYFQF